MNGHWVSGRPAIFVRLKGPVDDVAILAIIWPECIMRSFFRPRPLSISSAFRPESVQSSAITSTSIFATNPRKGAEVESRGFGVSAVRSSASGSVTYASSTTSTGRRFRS